MCCVFGYFGREVPLSGHVRLAYISGTSRPITRQIQQLQDRCGPIGDLLRVPDARISHAKSSIGGTATVLYSPSQQPSMASFRSAKAAI